MCEEINSPAQVPSSGPLTYYRGRSLSDPYYSRYERLRIQKFIPHFGQEILDVGAGDSFHLDLFTSLHHRKCTAIEPDPEARFLLQQKGYTVWEKLEQVDQTFDTVFLAHVIEHISPGNIYSFFNQITRCIRPGGNCVIISPVSKWFWDTPDHYRIYDRPAIRVLFRDFNLTEVLSIYQGSQNVTARILRILHLRNFVFQTDSLFRLFFHLSNFSKRDLIMIGRKNTNSE
jgi:cyclopropane fatty-acyl-phospholipid synthase-like methyltransferase